MKIQVIEGRLATHNTEAAVFVYFEDESLPAGATSFLDESLGREIQDIIGLGDFKGKFNEITVAYTHDNVSVKRIVSVGLGKRTDFSLERLRGAFAKAAQHIRSINVTEFSTALAFDDLRMPTDAAAEGVTEGVILGLYRYLPFKTVDRKDEQKIASFKIFINKGDLKTVRAAVKRAEIIANAVNFARDLVSAPGNEMTPTDLANAAQENLKGKNISFSVLNEAKMRKLGMNALLGVASGSHQPPKMIVAEYRGGKKSELPLALVGKGITFDSGGISIKPSENLDRMKTDMAGGAAVIATIRAASELSLPLNLIGIVPATENLPGGKAYKPGDILRSLSGQTIEVVNTDAEGRVILADALTYASRFKPAAIIDLATLTGACIVALGDEVIGMMGTDAELKGLIKEAAAVTGEKVWELPLGEQYDEMIKSDVADYKNSGGRTGGAITAATFLGKFVGGGKWVHLDIAGPSWFEKAKPYIPKGASGIGVRLLVQLLRNMTTEKQ
ncbi:MAG: leucyl aminopeptidase [Syntrophales bacterium]|jgi:leucyl aminopeptidase|nr:leucyl aminopeptidase [Syntrophales bacterium]